MAADPARAHAARLRRVGAGGRTCSAAGTGAAGEARWHKNNEGAASTSSIGRATGWAGFEAGRHGSRALRTNAKDLDMNRIGRIATLGTFSFIYAAIGLMVGLASGFIIMKLTGLAVGTDFVFTAVAQAVVAIWALALSVGAVLVYLRSPSGDLRS